MNEAWEWLLAGVVFVAISAVFARNGRIEWESGGHTTAKERPILFWSTILFFGSVGVVAIAFGIASLLGWRLG